MCSSTLVPDSSSDCILAHAVADERTSVPFWAALMFLIHPMTTETVTYISGRASGLMAFFYLLALFLYIKASEHQQAVSIADCTWPEPSCFSCSLARKKPRSRFRSLSCSGTCSSAG